MTQTNNTNAIYASMQLTPKLASAKTQNNHHIIWWMGPVGLPSGHDNFYAPTTWEPVQC